MSRNLDNFRVEHLAVPAYGEAQDDTAVQAAALGDSWITFVAFQAVINEVEIRLNGVLLPRGLKPLRLGLQNCLPGGHAMLRQCCHAA